MAAASAGETEKKVLSKKSMSLTKPPNFTRFETTGSLVVPGGSIQRAAGTSLVQSVLHADILDRASMPTVPAGAITLIPATRTTLEDRGVLPAEVVGALFDGLFSLAGDDIRSK
eukprot:scaffold250610_cov30-Tisochrysis_lutea.AAC.7